MNCDTGEIKQFTEDEIEVAKTKPDFEKKFAILTEQQREILQNSPRKFRRVVGKYFKQGHTMAYAISKAMNEWKK